MRVHNTTPRLNLNHPSPLPAYEAEALCTYCDRHYSVLVSALVFTPVMVVFSYLYI